MVFLQKKQQWNRKPSQTHFFGKKNHASDPEKRQGPSSSRVGSERYVNCFLIFFFKIFRYFQQRFIFSIISHDVLSTICLFTTVYRKKKQRMFNQDISKTNCRMTKIFWVDTGYVWAIFLKNFGVPHITPTWPNYGILIFPQMKKSSKVTSEV